MEESLAGLEEEWGSLDLSPAARREAAFLVKTEEEGDLLVEQILYSQGEATDYSLHYRVDVEKSREAQSVRLSTECRK